MVAERELFFFVGAGMGVAIGRLSVSELHTHRHMDSTKLVSGGY